MVYYLKNLVIILLIKFWDYYFMIGCELLRDIKKNKLFCLRLLLLVIIY